MNKSLQWLRAQLGPSPILGVSILIMTLLSVLSAFHISPSFPPWLGYVGFITVVGASTAYSTNRIIQLWPSVVEGAEPGSYRPSTFADPENSFHEKALLCRAAENSCYVASANVASQGSPTTSVVVRPDGTMLRYQPYGEEGLLITDIDLSQATRLLAERCRY